MRTTPTAKEILDQPHAEFCARHEGSYAHLNMRLRFDSGYSYGPGDLVLTAQIGTDSVPCTVGAIKDPAKRSYAHRLEIEFRNGANTHRLKHFAPILARFEKAMEERNLHMDYAGYPLIAQVLMQAAKLRYVFVNPTQPDGTRMFSPFTHNSGVQDWQLLDLRNVVDATTFATLVQGTIDNLWRKTVPHSTMRAAQEELDNVPQELRAA